MNLPTCTNLANLKICLSPTPKEMMDMDFICFDSKWNENDYREMQQQPSFNNWLLRIHDMKDVGMLSFHNIDPELEIIRLGIHPEWRNRGFAKLLLEQLEIFARESKIESILLEVNVFNKSAISLYNKFLFKEVGVRKNYFNDTGEDAFLFKKNLKYD